uniref:Glycylpeptide N-tetradecanoyltransferase n=1 Tax=Denticeps clupeoides TaxID=299321 RepID=A0AAY3ZY96_9TELE
MPENAHMASARPSEKKPGEDDQGKKKRKNKEKSWASGPRDPFEMLDALPEEKQQEIQKALHLFSLGQGPPRSLAEARRHTYHFWDTQPVLKIDEEVTSPGPVATECGPAREDPFSLPQGFVWDTLDLQNPTELGELCAFLNENYTEEDDNTLRLSYSPEFLQWALCPPGWQQQWHCGMRVNTNQKLVGFISAVPATIHVCDTAKQMVEVNFLCVHKRLRSKRVAPVLIREITRRVNRHGIFQAVYSASAVLPTPITTCRYWHRSLNLRKLVDVNFSSLGRNMTLQRANKLNRLPQMPKTSGLRPMSESDVSAVQDLLKSFLRGFELSTVLNREEVQHWLLPRDGVVHTYVVQSPEGVVTDLLSFYTLPYTILNHQVHKILKAAYGFYYASTTTQMLELMEDALIIAKEKGFDVFTMLDLMANRSVLEQLKFTTEDKSLHYYLYNWKCPSLTTDKVKPFCIKRWFV